MTLPKKYKRASAGLDKAGFTMVEVVVAMFIIAIVIAGLIPALVLNIRSNYMAKNYGVANYLAQRKIEQIRSWPQYETIALDNGDVLYGIENSNSDLFTDEVWGGEGHPYSTHTLPGVKETFTVTATASRNGYTGASDCKGYTFGGSIGNGTDDGWLNTTPVSGSSSEWPEDFVGSCGSGWRGEDFTIVRVHVTWTDKMRFTASHTIDRQAYIAKF